MKAVVTISRYWTNPQIFTTITDEGIALQISLNDFMKAFKNEFSSVTWVFTQQERDKRIDEAVTVVLEKIKEESIKVI